MIMKITKQLEKSLVPFSTVQHTQGAHLYYRLRILVSKTPCFCLWICIVLIYKSVTPLSGQNYTGTFPEAGGGGVVTAASPPDRLRWGGLPIRANTYDTLDSPA